MFPQQFENTGLNKVYTGPGFSAPSEQPKTQGFWGRLARAAYKWVSDRLEKSGLLASLLGEGIDALVNNSWQAGAQGKPIVSIDDTDYTPTPFEENVLNSFNENKFAPFFSGVVADVDAALTSQSLAAQLTAINRALYIIGVAREYFKTAQTAGLSLNGMQVRNESIFALCDQLEIAVNKILDQHPESFKGVLVQVQASPADFAPFTVPASTYTVKNYQLESGSIGTAQPIVNPSAASTGKDNTLAWVIGGLALVGVATAMSAGGKKAKSKK